MHDRELQAWRNLMENGTQCLGQERYLDAENYYMQGLSIAYQLTVPEILAFTLRLLATVRVRLGNLELADKGFQEALEICQTIQNAKGMAEAWAGLASVSVKKGTFQKAGREYEQAISVYPSSSPPLRLGMLYADLGQVYATLEDWSRAQKAFTQAQDICHANGFPKGVGELDVLLGELCFRQKKIIEASRKLIHACQVFAQISDIVSLTNALQYLALIYFDQNKMRLAFECQQRAVALCLKFDNKYVFSESCFFLSKIEQLLEEYEEAKYYLQLSIKSYPDQDFDLALRYQSLAGLFFLSMDLPKAEHYYQNALQLYEIICDAQRIIEVREALVVLNDIRNQSSEAVEIEPKIQDNFSLDALIKLGEFYENRQDFRNALECYWRSMEIAKNTNFNIEWIEARVQRVSKYLRRKKS